MSIYTTTYLNSLSARGIHTDRVISEDVKLPNEFAVFNVKPNDIISTSFKKAVTALHENFLFLISSGKIASHKIPTNYTHYLSGASPSFHAKDTFRSLVNNISSSEILKGVKSVLFVDTDDPSSNGALLCSGTEIKTMTYNEPIGSGTNLIGGGSGGTSVGKNLGTFSNIKRCRTDGIDAFVLDGNMILKYDIAGITHGDEAGSSSSTPGRILKGILGGVGTLESDITFANPVSIDVIDSKLYVIDYESNSAYIKVYDTNLNYKYKFDITTEAKSRAPVDIMVNTDGSIFVLFVDGYIGIYKNNKLQKLYTAYRYASTETFKELISSKADNNIFYTMSNINVFKRFKTKPSDIIAKFSKDENYLNYGEDLTPSFNGLSVRLVNGVDNLFIADSNYGVVFRIEEWVNYISLFYSDYESEIYELDSLLPSSNEFDTNFTFNKTFQKLLFNHKLLINAIKSRPRVNERVTGEKVLIGKEYISGAEKDSLKLKGEENYLLGINEVMAFASLNRIIKEFYKVQKNILNISSNKTFDEYPTGAIEIVAPPGATPSVTPSISVSPTPSSSLLAPMYTKWSLPITYTTGAGSFVPSGLTTAIDNQGKLIVFSGNIHKIETSGPGIGTELWESVRQTGVMTMSLLQSPSIDLNDNIYINVRNSNGDEGLAKIDTDGNLIKWFKRDFINVLTPELGWDFLQTAIDNDNNVYANVKPFTSGRSMYPSVIKIPASGTGLLEFITGHFTRYSRPWNHCVIGHDGNLFSTALTQPRDVGGNVYFWDGYNALLDTTNMTLIKLRFGLSRSQDDIYSSSAVLSVDTNNSNEVYDAYGQQDEALLENYRFLHKLDENFGTLNWMIDVASTGAPSLPSYQAEYARNVLIGSNKIYIQGDYGVYCLDTNGGLIWNIYDTGVTTQPNGLTDIAYHNPRIALLDNNTLVYASMQKILLINSDNGTLIAERDGNWIPKSLVVDANGDLYIGSFSGGQVYINCLDSNGAGGLASTPWPIEGATKKRTYSVDQT